MDFFEATPAIRKQYGEKGWTVLKRVLPLELADATLFKIQQELGGDWESYKGDYIKTFLTEKKAYESYSFDYTPMATLQWGLTPFVSTLVGKDLLPSHAYFRVYRGGDVCNIHSDAPNCEHSLSLVLGYSDELLWDFTIIDKYYDADKELPATQANKEGNLPVRNVTLSTGDAILYNGVNFLHGRASPNPNRWSAHLFLHWVDRNGKYAKHAFDGRAGEVVRKADFRFPAEDAPEKVNPARATMSESRGR